MFLWPKSGELQPIFWRWSKCLKNLGTERVNGMGTVITFTIRIKHHILNYLVLENASRICQSEMHLKNARRSTKFSIFSPHMASCFLVSTTTVLRFAQCKYAFLNALKYFYDMSQQLSRICYENWEHYKTALSNTYVITFCFFEVAVNLDFYQGLLD